ncbi:hypothetical protein BH10PSE19_BH10PSE19_07580 [soil metagenome]
MNNKNVTIQEALFAGGCFWGVEYYLQKLPGVLATQVGYTGGHKDNPTYSEVCSGNTGHVEAIHIIFDPQQISYRKLNQYFFEIHDPTQTNGQGPDLGEQYLSRIYYYDDKQKAEAQILIAELQQQGYNVATQILPVTTFWPAEAYHQSYYLKTQHQPYCHGYVKRFKD